MQIRKTEARDLDAILAIYDQARVFMVSSGNLNQWVAGYPGKEHIVQDIEKGHSYVCYDDEDILGVFYFAVETEPNYQRIDGGAWLNGAPYGVVHRIAVADHQRGVASFCLDWCFQQHGNIRIDTHRDNQPMQALVKKQGYTYCGVIYLPDGAERLAYQKTSAHFTQQSVSIHRGGCLCGQVRFEVHGDFESFYFCHCSRCRKITGSAHAANLFSKTATLHWISGEEAVQEYLLPDTRFSKSFCKHCGSALPLGKPGTGLLKVPAGSLDTPLEMLPTNHIFLEDRAFWGLAQQSEGNLK